MKTPSPIPGFTVDQFAWQHAQDHIYQEMGYATTEKLGPRFNAQPEIIMYDGIRARTFELVEYFYVAEKHGFSIRIKTK